VLLCRRSCKSQHSAGDGSPTAEGKGRWWVGEEGGKQYILCSSSSLVLGSSICVPMAFNCLPDCSCFLPELKQNMTCEQMSNIFLAFGGVKCCACSSAGVGGLPEKSFLPLTAP